MINHLTINHLKVSLQKSLNYKSMTNRCMCKAHGRLHILDIRKILFGHQNRTLLLLALQNVGAIADLHRLLTIVVETIKIQECKLLALVNQGFHPLESLTVSDQPRVLGNVNLLTSFEVGKSLILSLFSVPVCPVKHVVSFVTEFTIRMSHHGFGDLSHFFTIHVITILEVSFAGLTTIIVMREHFSNLPEDFQTVRGCAAGPVTGPT